MNSFLLTRATRLLLPITLLFAAYLLLRGHDRPGGGFSAGLVSSLALITQVFAFGLQATLQTNERVLRPAMWVGLVLATGTGMIPLALGDPLLTHYHLTLALGGAHVDVSTTLLFDLGVYAVVVGATAIIARVLVEGGGK